MKYWNDRDEWEKTDIEWKDNDESIEYNQLRYFKFLPNESVGRLRDQVTIPNIPMIVSTTTIIQIEFKLFFFKNDIDTKF